MSRILPIKKSLDDRFINETDVITEQALAQVIEGQGDGSGCGIEIVRFSAVYDEPTGSLLVLADKTYDELLQSFQDGKIIFGLTPDYEAQERHSGCDSALSCNLDSDTGRFIFTGFLGDGSDITHNCPQLRFMTIALNSDNSTFFESHFLSSEIELEGDSIIYTGSPYILNGTKRKRTYLLSLGGMKSASYEGTGATEYGVIWDVHRISGTNIMFSVEDVLVGESRKALAIDTSSASSGEVAQAVVTAGFYRDMGGLRFVANMLVTVRYDAPL